MNKLLVCAVFCVALSSIVESAIKPSPHAVWGAKQLGDERLLYRFVKDKSSWFIKAVVDVDYPGKDAYSTGNITYIEAINQIPDSGSSVTITKGGVGFPFVKLHFKSTRTGDIDYILQIFGKLNNAHPGHQPPQNYAPPYPPANPIPVAGWKYN